MTQKEDFKLANDPQLVDSENIMMVTGMDYAKVLLKDVFDTMVIVTRWMPAQNKEIGITFEPKTKRIKSSFSNSMVEVRPVIYGTIASWGYSEDKIKTALKIFSLMGWHNPEFHCPSKEAFPLMIKCGKRYNYTSKEAVILIAPRVSSNY